MSIPLSVLLNQRLTLAPSHSKVILSMLSLGICDALGGPAEFSRRGSFPKIISMQPNDNFGLPPGTWTDDTSMMLCLAHSLAPPKEFSEIEQLRTYVQWWEDGYLSATGTCFDIGNTIRTALGIWCREAGSIHDPGTENDWQEKALCRIRTDLDKEVFSGNGSLMRVLPIGLAYWRDPLNADEFARRSSVTTHPNIMCQEACALYTHLIVVMMQENDHGGRSDLSKLDILRRLASYPLTHPRLKAAFSFHHSVEEDLSDHPLLHKTSDQISSSGYVLHTLEAALWAFFRTQTFEDGAICVVNLGDDADTVAAVYGGLAGCWYGQDRDTDVGGVGGNGFWSERVRQWVDGLVQKDFIEVAATELASWSSSRR